ncbi:hypothetical protein ICV35_22535 [Rhodococcus ruber]|uniref:hypothetical protein n=1 Tax=Rhodococcus ruber TaxID=1830 RepID=UPI001780E065|nr:hypothetical protein [Rhodococcus ruber]MBD8056433.1 hypothetical protein [Rhodococcus ruber]
MTAPSLWETCIVPGCKQPVAEELDVCQTCRTVFGDYLRETDRPPRYTRADLDRADAEVLEMYRLLARRHVEPEQIDTDSELYRRAATLATTSLQHAGELERANQRCWICDERRTCLLRPGGWECRTCRQIG